MFSVQNRRKIRLMIRWFLLSKQEECENTFKTFSDVLYNITCSNIPLYMYVHVCKSVYFYVTQSEINKLIIFLM